MRPILPAAIPACELWSLQLMAAVFEVRLAIAGLAPSRILVPDGVQHALFDLAFLSSGQYYSALRAYHARVLSRFRFLTPDSPLGSLKLNPGVSASSPIYLPTRLTGAAATCFGSTWPPRRGPSASAHAVFLRDHDVQGCVVGVCEPAATLSPGRPGVIDPARMGILPPCDIAIDAWFL